MKKVFYSLAIVIFILNYTYGQNWGGQNPVNSLIKPNESRGYILWSRVPNADYVVNVFEKDSLNNLNLIATKSTDNNYARLSSYLTNPKAYYSVSAHNSGNGALIVTSDPQPVNDLPPTTVCEKKCNGLTYSYQFNHMEDTPEFGSGGAHFLTVYPTNDVVDNVNGIIVPFWQARSTIQYNQLSPNHPYKRATANGPVGQAVYEYKHAQIINGNAGTIGGPFFDAQNNVVADGWLIEKKTEPIHSLRDFKNNITTRFKPMQRKYKLLGKLLQ